MSAYRPVVAMPPGAPVLDFSRGPLARVPAYAVGRYDDARPGAYPARFAGRDVHVGVDLFAPEGTPVMAFADGAVALLADNGGPGDYGPTLVTEHVVDGAPLWALHGHLSARSLEGMSAGRGFRAGDVIGWIGGTGENGGWPPHLHFQLSRRRPDAADLPGVVAAADRARALELYPDPRLVLGELY